MSSSYCRTVVFLLAAGMGGGAAAQTGKPTAPVAITHSVSGDPAKQEPVVTTIRLVAEADLATLEVTLAADDGLEIVAAEPAAFPNVRAGETRSVEATVRLTGPHVGYLSVFATATLSGLGTRTKASSLAIGTPAPSEARASGAEEDLSDLVLVRSAGDKAVIRFGDKQLRIVSVGDRLGRNRARVTEIDDERLILDEVYKGKDGRPNRARVILRRGERGGRRYQVRPDEEPPPAVRPKVIEPKDPQ
jgi:hypothetical protein